MSSVRLEILGAMTETAETTAAELSQRTNASDPTLRTHLDAMVDAGLILERRGESDGLTTGRPPTRFRLDSEVRDSAEALFSVLARPLGS